VRNIADVLSPQGILFGGTVLGLQGNHTKSALAFLRAANKQGASKTWTTRLRDFVLHGRRLFEMRTHASSVREFRDHLAVVGAYDPEEKEEALSGGRTRCTPGHMRSWSARRGRELVYVEPAMMSRLMPAG
jgi:hypothetical protein